MLFVKHQVTSRAETPEQIWNQIAWAETRPGHKTYKGSSEGWITSLATVKSCWRWGCIFPNILSACSCTQPVQELVSNSLNFPTEVNSIAGYYQLEAVWTMKKHLRYMGMWIQPLSSAWLNMSGALSPWRHLINWDEIGLSSYITALDLLLELHTNYFTKYRGKTGKIWSLFTSIALWIT